MALGHGLNGMRTIIDDYIRAPGKRASVKALLYTTTGVLFAYGTLVIVTFQSV
jgi:succinate dehydrogenase hydrophobic anchor subunit